MRKTNRSQQQRPTGGLARKPLLIWASVVALLGVALLTGCSQSLSNDPKNLFAEAEPATVMVQVQVTAHISTPSGWIYDASKIRDALSAEGVTASSPNYSSAYFNLIVGNPIEYLDPDYSSTAAEADATSAWWGSGFIADPNGYIVTNAHVAAPPDDDVKSGLVSQGLQTLINKDVAAWAATNSYTADELTQLQAMDTAWRTHYVTVTNQVKTISVVMGANVEGADVAPKLITADVVAAGDEIPGKDVAIIKVEGQNYPTVPIGDDTQLNVGDKLYVIGYPNVAEGGVNQLISTNSITEPTFTTGVVSAKKQATQGYQVLQTDAAVTHGNSGGPVLNSQGQVVGIATFGGIDPSTGQAVQGYNFIMPSTLIKQFLGRTAAQPGPSEFTKLYNQGLAQEAASQFKAAEATFQQIQTLSPGNPYVQQHVSQDGAAIAAGKDHSFGGGWVVAIVVLIIVIGVVVLFVRRRRIASRPVTVNPVVTTQGYPSSVGTTEASPLPAPPMNPPAELSADATPAAPAVGGPEGAPEHGTPEVTLLVVAPSGTHQVVAALPAIIGHGADAQVVVDDPGVSPHHAAIALVDGVLEVTDLGGLGGIQVNDATVKISQLQRGDRIKVGASEIVIE